MNKLFSVIPNKVPGYNKFDLSREHKLTCKTGDLVPVYLEEVLPGDKFRVQSQTFLRLMPLISPVMHRMNVTIHYFYVPNRIIWDDWEDFLKGEEVVHPKLDIYSIAQELQDYMSEGKLWDYLSLPTIQDGEPSDNGNSVNSLPFRAYQLIYNEYYRDQNLSTEIDVPKTEGQETLLEELLTLRKRSWEKDYFTSALEDPTGEEVGVPVDINYSAYSKVLLENGSAPASTTGIRTGITDGSNVPTALDTNARIRIENLDSTNTVISLQELRRTARLQEFLEKMTRSGKRLKEIIFAFFGVHNKDSRLQRPEYLGGGKQKVIISEVLNNTAINGEEPLGTYAGHGISVGNTHSFTKFVEEHGWIIGIMSITPTAAYFQGIPRKFFKTNRFDYYWPQFAAIGEQPIMKQELYFDPTADEDTNQGEFGYAPRYSELKFGLSSCHGQMRSSLLHFHLARNFSSLPGLNQEFIEVERIKRIFAVTSLDEDEIIAQIGHSVQALRKMPFFGTPTL